MSKIVSKTVKVTCAMLPPTVDFIEKKIKEHKINPLRWSIVEIKGMELTLSVSGEEI